jgi:hypothetical protein
LEDGSRPTAARRKFREAYPVSGPIEGCSSVIHRQNVRYSHKYPRSHQHSLREQRRNIVIGGPVFRACRLRLLDNHFEKGIPVLSQSSQSTTPPPPSAGRMCGIPIIPPPPCPPITMPDPCPLPQRRPILPLELIDSDRWKNTGDISISCKLICLT